ncbi:hypothetical protein RHMOL_Rhmol11G0023500 [Rhododendron molle]|uniref:Uncharacterized protein n=1 Tax=Rhododendron molle TaxID=49168 RepID=A0ACC0LN45_RHOML|nr:hypothetical protein RHMOL_Rhmol11G0023500 [Rhododendron molle]
MERFFNLNNLKSEIVTCRIYLIFKKLRLYLKECVSFRKKTEMKRIFNLSNLKVRLKHYF